MNLKNNDQKLLDVWSGHIPEDTACALYQDLADHKGLWFDMAYEKWSTYGWIINVDESSIEAVKNSGHLELAQLLILAYQEDYQYLKLDCDAQVLPADSGFAIFNW